MYLKTGEVSANKLHGRYNANENVFSFSTLLKSLCFLLAVAAEEDQLGGALSPQ